MSKSDVHVLVTGKLALALAAMCCSADARERTPFVLSACVVQTRAEANVTRLEWRCRRDRDTLHSQWFCSSDVAFVEKAADANAALGRGAHEPPFEAENSHRIALWTSPALGRFSVTSERIEPGTCVLRATAFAVAIKQQLVRTHCHWCFATLKKKALQCGACAFARYCSRDCLDTDAALHGSQCRALQQLQSDSSSHHFRSWTDAGVDAETIRLALAVLSMERFVGSMAPLARLVTHAPASVTRASVLDHVARFVVAAMSGDGTKRAGPGADHSPSLQHVKQTLARVQCNAHPLCVSGAVTLGVGVFPDAAMALNHSCLPNVVPSFDPATRTLAFHAIRTIDAAQAVEYAYIDVLQATARRQDALVDGFGFRCTCWRCSVPEPRVATADRDAEALVTHELLALERQAQTASSRTLGRAVDALLERHERTFARSPELLVAAYTLQLQVAGAHSDWPRALASAQAIEQLWRAQGLPETHPTLEVLAREVERAATHIGDVSLAAAARTRGAAIRQTCGYRSSA